MMRVGQTRSAGVWSRAPPSTSATGLRLRENTGMAGEVGKNGPGSSGSRRVAEAVALLEAELREIGYQYVTLDLSGFRSGSMNEVIAFGERQDGRPPVMKGRV